MKLIIYLFVILITINVKAFANNNEFICYRLTNEIFYEVTNNKDFLGFYQMNGSFTAKLKLNNKNISFKKLNNSFTTINADFIKSHYLDLSGLNNKSGKKLSSKHLNDYYKSNKKSVLNSTFNKKKEDVYFQVKLIRNSNNYDQIDYISLVVFRKPINLKLKPIQNSNLKTHIYPPKINASVVDILNYPPAFFTDTEILEKIENYSCE